jgi:hypothetical protein
MIIKSHSGLGDGIYLHPICKHLAKKDKIILLSNYPDIYKDLNIEVKPHKTPGLHVDMRLSYVGRKPIQETNQYQDLLISGGLPDIPFEIEWKITNKLYKTKKVCLYPEEYKPLGREDGFGKELNIDWSIIDKLKEKYKDEIEFIKVGQGITTIIQLIDYAAQCDFSIAPVGHLLSLSEIFNKPILTIFSRRGLSSSNPFIFNITPKKVLCKNTSKYIIDDYKFENIINKFEEVKNAA